MTARARDLLVAPRATELGVARQLRKSMPAEQALAALALLEGRRALEGKHAEHERLFFDRAAAEQATPAPVAAYTANRLAHALLPGERLADLGCGAGADAVALAERASVVGVDLDETRLAMLEANADALGVTSRIKVEHADLAAWLPPSDVAGAWLDPSRRDEHGRRLDPRLWSPPLEEAIAVGRRYRAAGIKLAPGIDPKWLPDDGEVEFISNEGRLIEAVLWIGAACEPGVARVTVLPGASMARARREPDLEADVRPPGAYLYDPDPGVGRAGVVRALARDLEGWQLNEEVAYVSSDAAHSTAFARRFRVLEVGAFSERRARDALARAHASRVDVMRRGAPVDTNEIERRLNASLSGEGPVVTLALTRLDGRISMLLCLRERD